MKALPLRHQRTVWIALILFLIAPQMLAESVNVTVTAYNKAAISGDGADGMEVVYQQLQSTPYKSRLSAGDTAIMHIIGLPHGSISSLSLSMHSNKAAGAGSLFLTIDDELVWYIADSKFNSDNWYGSYSDTYVPIEKMLSVSCGVLDIVIISSANSLYFEGITINYSLAPPMQHLVCLDFGTGENMLLREESPNAGVVLPYIEPVNDTWYGVGWSETSIGQQTSAPYYYIAGATFYPSENVTLHALYVNSNGLSFVEQDTLFTDGEYLLGFAEPFCQMAAGAVRSKVVPLISCNVQASASGLYSWTTDYAGANLRYVLTFDSDSVEIFHPATNSYVGHSATAISSSHSKWAWQRAKNNTLCISFSANTNDYCLLPKDEVLSLFPLEANDPLKFEHIVLFPSANIPLSAPLIIYTSWPSCGVGYDIQTLSNTHTNTQKVFYNGEFLIISNGVSYDLLGRKRPAPSK